MAINLYKLLNIPGDASVDDIRRAIEVATSYGSLDEKMRATAQNVLLNPAMRQEYDRRLAGGQVRQSSPIPAVQPQSSPPPAAATTFSGVETFTPYRAPQSEVSDVHDGEGVRASGRLFTPDGIGIITFLSSLFVGGIVLYLNFRRLGKRQTGAAALLICWLIQGVLMGAGAEIVNSSILMRTLIFFGVPIAIMLYAKSSQGADIQSHCDAGGKMFSNWLALGIGLLVLIGFLTLMVIMAFLPMIIDPAPVSS